jgi:hypothetical protein
MCYSILLFVTHLCALENALKKKQLFPSRSREVISDGFGPRYRVLVSGPKTVSITSLLLGPSTPLIIVLLTMHTNDILMIFFMIFMTVTPKQSSIASHSRVEWTDQKASAIDFFKFPFVCQLPCFLFNNPWGYWRKWDYWRELKICRKKFSKK